MLWKSRTGRIPTRAWYYVSTGHQHRDRHTVGSGGVRVRRYACSCGTVTTLDHHMAMIQSTVACANPRCPWEFHPTAEAGREHTPFVQKPPAAVSPVFL